MAIMNPSKLRNCYDALPHSNLSDTKQKALEALIMKYLNGEIVSVVRCKDCKELFHDGDMYCCSLHKGLVFIKADSFCSYGERKEDS